MDGARDRAHTPGMSDSELAAAGRRKPSADPRTAEIFHSNANDPIARFGGLLALAREEPGHTEPTAMSLATLGPDGALSSRIVLLKSFDARGFTFFTNLNSRKGRGLLAHPGCALLFHWQPLEVQVRIEGNAAQVADAEADEYFATRPRQSQLGAWASDQSAALGSREELLARMEALVRRFEGHPVPRPPHWSGFRVAPRAIEFWRNQESRLHERELYTRASGDAAWVWRLLNP